MANIEYGQSGPEVRRVQEALVAQGYYVGTVDGVFGEKTAAAVAYFQSTHGMTIDAVVGPHMKEYLDLEGGLDIQITATWPNVEVWHAGEPFVVQLTPIAELTQAIQCRVVAWFRGPGGEENTEAQATVNPGSSAARVELHLPQRTAATQGEVYFTGYVFDMRGEMLTDEGTGSFRVDLPDRIG